MEEYINFFRDIDLFLENKTSKTRSLEFCVVGYAALAFAGLKFKSVAVKTLNPTDVCVSKIFSYSNSQVRRSNDRTDIVNALEYELVSFGRFVKRLEEILPCYETHAEAPTAFPIVLKLVKELASNYDPSISLKYELPNWMINM